MASVYLCPGGSRPPAQAMSAFINEHRAIRGAEPICPSYHAHAARRADSGKLLPRARRDAALKIEIGRVYNEYFRVYGVRKVWRQLGRTGIAVARCTVTPDGDDGLQGSCGASRSGPQSAMRRPPCPLDRVNRQFRAPRPNAV